MRVFDFKKFAQIGATINSNDPQIKQEGGLNHPFILNGDPIAAELKSSDKTKCLKMTTTNPSIVAYTGNHFNHTNFTKNIGKYGGIALEAQYPPTNDIRLLDIVLTPDEQYYAKTTWNFTF